MGRAIAAKCILKDVVLQEKVGISNLMLFAAICADFSEARELWFATRILTTRLTLGISVQETKSRGFALICVLW